MTTPGDVTGLWASARVTELLDGVDVEPPTYGSSAWLELPGGDPRRPAALITAAEQWRRLEAERARLDQLAEDDPDAWFAEVTAEADNAARRLARRLELSRRPTVAELERRRTHREPREVVATPGWPPVAIPGRPGWWRHCIDGRQVDLPRREPHVQHQEAA